ncbi:hypothetical protein M9458_017324, partial [Cirrhinus mrigala]
EPRHLCGVGADDDTSPTPDPVPSPTSPHSVEHQPEPTTDGEPKPSTTDEQSPRRAAELRIIPEPEAVTSDQVREPATSLPREEFTVDMRMQRKATPTAHPLR